jgi:hypothetical protein
MRLCVSSYAVTIPSYNSRNVSREIFGCVLNRLRCEFVFVSAIDRMVTPRNRAQEKTVSMSRQERINISDRTRAGLQRAVKAGKVLGRREVSVDVVRARKMQREGLGLRPIAKKLRISVNTLQLRK